MKIVQICNHLFYGDGVSNYILSMSKVLDDLNLDNTVAVRITDGRVSCQKMEIFNNVKELHISNDDIVIYHFHGGGDLNYQIEKLSCKKIMVFQNVTPPYFFYDTDWSSVKICLMGQSAASRTRHFYSKAITMSDFSVRDLIGYGWAPEDIYKIPMMDNKAGRIKSEPVDWWEKDCVNLLFVGRMAPNKKIEDLISFANYYEKNSGRKSKLILVGGKPYKNYFQSLKKYVELLGCHNVFFADFLSDEQLNYCYENSDIFLCMSEHEGLCMPIIEAMQLKLPVVAYNSSAVGETVGKAGTIFEKKDYALVSDIINRILDDESYRNTIVCNQIEHASKLEYSENIARVKAVINQIMEQPYEENKYIGLPIGINYQAIENRLNEQFVIYGAGNAGQKFYSEMKNIISIEAFCDNGDIKNTIDISSYKHDECVRCHKDAVYVITVQKRPSMIAADLIRSGVDASNIYIYMLDENKIE